LPFFKPFKRNFSSQDNKRPPENLFSQKKYVRKIDWAHVKVLTNFACQLLFLVVGTKTYKLWSKFEEQDHETRL
jgi:hypothetical protein